MTWTDSYRCEWREERCLTLETRCDKDEKQRGCAVLGYEGP